MTGQVVQSMLLKAAIAASLVAGASVFGQAHADWPNDKPIEVVVGFAAGGGTDVMARKLSAAMERHFDNKAKFIVLNRPGASGEIAVTSIMRAQPDGSTIGVVNVPGYIFLPMMKATQYKTEEIRLVARVVDDPTVVVVRADSKLNDLKALVDALRAAPSSITVGHNGVGTNGHLALRMLAQVANVNANEVAYRGTAAQKTDLLGGHLMVALVSVGEVPELHGSNKGELKVIAQLSRVRSPALQMVPTAEEGGFPVFMSSERGFAVPKDVPDAVVQKLEKAISDSLKDEEYLKNSPGDAPVISFMPGKEWKLRLDDLAQKLRPIAESVAK